MWVWFTQLFLAAGCQEDKSRTEISAARKAWVLVVSANFLVKENQQSDQTFSEYHTVHLLFAFQCLSKQAHTRENQWLFWFILRRGSDAAGPLRESKQTKLWLLIKVARYHMWPLECAVRRDCVGLIFLPRVSRKQRMLRCWWTPGISLQTFNSNITVLTDGCKGITRGQDY